MTSAHEQLQRLDQLAQRYGPESLEVAILKGFAARAWKAHASTPNSWWTWSFATLRTGTYLTEEGWNAHDVLLAFSLIDPRTRIDANLDPTAHNYAPPTITAQAVREVCGLGMEGNWVHNMAAPSCGFVFQLPA